MRRRAIEALAELRPGGDGSWFRALGALASTPLAEVAARARQRYRTEGPAPDAELAVGDAKGVWFAH